MTEAQWLACAEPERMLEFLRGKARERKLRLLACACCRRVAHLLSDPEFLRSVEIGELYADKQAKVEDCRRAHQIAYEGRRNNIDLAVAWATMVTKKGGYSVGCVGYVAENSCRLGGQWISGRALDAPQLREQAEQVALVRDIFGNPFHPVTFSPAWRTDTAVSLAKQMYESREFSAMPILADALQDAGCDNDDILNHCRGDGPHVRGCWVVDLVLGKE